MFEILKNIVVVVCILLILLLCMSHYRQSGLLSDHSKMVHRIMYEDVESRMAEAVAATTNLVQYRKLREAHASLETLSAMVGGYHKLERLGIQATSIDITLFDLETDVLKKMDVTP